MIIGSIISLLFILSQSGNHQNSSPSDAGMICVSPVPKPNSEAMSLANPAGGNRAFNYSIQVDNGAIKPVTQKNGTRINGLSMKQSHLLKIRREGKIAQSFRFTFEKEGSNQLCLWFKSLYETWSLWTVKEAGNKCACK